MNNSKPQPGPGESLDRLAGEWWIFQLQRGHRYNTDDVLTAWCAARAHPAALSLLDLGAGVGSVGMMTLLRLQEQARLVSIEVQQISAALAKKSVAYNQIEQRVEVRCGDLRDEGLVGPDEHFDLITANPPYLPPHKATASPHPQRASARLELHGDIFDYCARAAEHLATKGRFCFCHAASDPRPEQAIARAGLQLESRQLVHFRHAQAPMIALFTCSADGQRREDPDPLLVRGPDGARTEAYRRVRREMLIEH